MTLKFDSRNKESRRDCLLAAKLLAAISISFLDKN